MLLRPLPEDLRAHHLAAVNRREGEAHGSADQRGLALVRFLLQVIERLFVAVLELLLDGMLAGEIVLAFERRGDGRAQVLDQALHVAAQRDPATGRQAQRARLVRLGEIVDVAPVGRGRLARGLLLDIAPDQRHLAGARGPEGEQVVSVPPDPDAEADRFHCAVLADRIVERLEVVGGGEVEPVRIAGSAESPGGQRRQLRHMVILPRWRRLMGFASPLHSVPAAEDLRRIGAYRKRS